MYIKNYSDFYDTENTTPFIYLEESQYQVKL